MAKQKREIDPDVVVEFDLDQRLASMKEEDQKNDILTSIVSILYAGDEGWQPYKEWDSETVAAVAKVLDDHGLVPEED